MKFRTLLFLLVATMTTRALRAEACPPQPTTFAAMRDCYRPLLVFSPDATDARFNEQMTELRSHTAALRERDVRVSVILPIHASFPPQALDGIPAAFLTVEAYRQANQQFQTGGQMFSVVLLGKDGGEKLRSQVVLRVEHLSRTIDGMPMRQDEIKQQR